jgi:hypothetical protein
VERLKYKWLEDAENDVRELKVNAWRETPNNREEEGRTCGHSQMRVE